MVVHLIKLFEMVSAAALRDEAQNLIEYGLIVALIAFGVTAAMQTVGTDIAMIYTAISSTVASSLGSS